MRKVEEDVTSTVRSQYIATSSVPAPLQPAHPWRGPQVGVITGRLSPRKKASHSVSRGQKVLWSLELKAGSFASGEVLIIPLSARENSPKRELLLRLVRAANFEEALSLLAGLPEPQGKKGKAGRQSRTSARSAYDVSVHEITSTLPELPPLSEKLPTVLVERQPVMENWQRAEALRWKVVREEFLKLHESVPTAILADVANSGSVNPSALVHGWLLSKRAFRIKHGGKWLFPLFQMGKDGQPKPQFRVLLNALDGRLDGWPLAIWLTSPNAELPDWQKPLDVIERDPESVAKAALREVEEAVY